MASAMSMAAAAGTRGHGGGTTGHGEEREGAMGLRVLTARAVKQLKGPGEVGVELHLTNGGAARGGRKLPIRELQPIWAPIVNAGGSNRARGRLWTTRWGQASPLAA